MMISVLEAGEQNCCFAVPSVKHSSICLFLTSSGFQRPEYQPLPEKQIVIFYLLSVKVVTKGKFRKKVQMMLNYACFQ